MPTTSYFDEQVLRKRPYLSEEMCRAVLANPIKKEVESDGRRRHWGRVRLPSEVEERNSRVVTLEDGNTLHNAFLDRGFREDQT